MEKKGKTPEAERKLGLNFFCAFHSLGTTDSRLLQLKYYLWYVR